MTIFSKDFTRQRSRQDELVKKRILWYCNKCWQEGDITIEVTRKDFNTYHILPKDVPECRRQHENLIAGIPGASCEGALLPQLKQVKKRVKREPLPELAGIDTEPIILK